METLRLTRGDIEPDSFFVASNYGPMLFDTGAASSQLKRSDRTAGLKGLGPVMSRGAAGMKEQELARVKDLRVGDLAAPPITVTLDDTHSILGLDVMGEWAYVFDVDRLEARFTEHFTDGVPCRKSPAGHLFLPVEIGGRETWALLDTGASVSLIDAAFYRDTFGHVPEGPTDRGEDFTGAALSATLVSIDSLKVGGLTCPAHRFAALDFREVFPPVLREAIGPIGAVIGATTLSALRFTIDHKNGRVKVGPYERTDER